MNVFSFFKHKWISLLLVESLIFHQAVYASDNAKDIRSFVPAKYGSVRNIHLNPKSDKWVIHIQDAHCNLDAQQNISNILRKMLGKNRLDLVLLEGSSGKIDPSVLKDYPDKTSRNNVSDYLLKSADISGSEYFLITQDSNVPVMGMENNEVYVNNLKVLWKVMDLKPENNSILDKLSDFVDKYKPQVYSGKLLEFDKLYLAFRNHSLEIEDYLNFFKANTEISEEKFPDITKINKINSLKRNINFNRLEEETHEVFNILSTNLTRDKLGELFRLNLAFKVGEVTAGEFYCYLVNLIKTEKLDKTGLENIYLYGKLALDYESVDQQNLYMELNSLEDFYTARLFRNRKEKNLFKINKICMVLRDFFNLTLSFCDKEFFMSNKDLFSKDAIIALFKDIAEGNGINELEPYIVALDKNIGQVGEFYELAHKRDEILVKNAITEIEKNKSKWTVLIAGGFHTDGICELLNSKEVNYAVVVPKIKNITDQNLYLSVITHTKNPFEKFIESAINSLADSSWLAENPIGFDVSRKQVKLAKAISLFLAESADNVYLKNPMLAPDSVLDELNKIIEGFDTHDVKITDFKRVDGYRLYKMEIHGRQMFYYFEDKDALQSDLRELLFSDLNSILAREIDLADKKSVTVFTPEIMAVLGPKLDQLQIAQEDAKKTGRESGVKFNQIKNAVLDYAFLRSEFNIAEMMSELRMKHRFDFDFRKDIQPVLEKLIGDNWIYGNFQDQTGGFVLSEDARLAYYLTIMSESDNFFPDIEQLKSFNVGVFEHRQISAVAVEAGLPVDSIIALIRDMEQSYVKGEDKSVFEYLSSDGTVFEGRIIDNRNGFKYLRMVKKQTSEPKQTFDDSIGNVFSPENTGLIKLEENNKSALVISVENGAYNISLIEPGNNQRLDTILFQDRILINDQTKENLNKTIDEIMNKFSSYIFLQGVVIITDEMVKYLKPEELQNGMLEEMLSGDRITDLIMDEIDKLNLLIANQGDGAPIESLTTIYDEDVNEQDIVDKLSTYSANALIEIAKTTRNPAYLRVLAKNTIYSTPKSRIKIGDFVTNKIKAVLIDNSVTPTDSLTDLVNDSLFFGYLLKNNPEKIKDLIKHPQAMGELIEIIADKIAANEWKIAPEVIEDLKQAIIVSPLSDEVLLMQYFQDPSIKVRISLARSPISDIMADDPADDVKLEVAKNPDTSLAYLYRFAEPGVSKQIKLALASNTMIDKYIVDRLIAENDEDIKVMLANTLANSDLPMFQKSPGEIDKYLLRLIDECGDSVDAAIAAAKRQLSFAVLDRLIIQGPKIQLLVADRNDLTTDLIKKLYSNSNEEVKTRLVFNTSVDLPYSEYRKAIIQSRNEKDGWKIRFAITKKQKLAVPVMQELLKDKSAKVRSGLATREDLPEEMFDELSRDPAAFVRAYVAGNTSAPLSVIKKLGEDESKLSEGLINETGEVEEGFTRDSVMALEHKGRTVLHMLSLNRKILKLPNITDKLLRDYHYHGEVLRMISRLRESAISFYEDKDYEKAYDLLKSLGESKYAPFGVLFDLGNISYRLHNSEKALKYYAKSFKEVNDACSFIAMYFLKNEGKVPETLLNLSAPLQTIIQNFHNARQITEKDIPAVMDFVNFVTQPIPEDLVPSYMEYSVTWENLLAYEDYENLIALKLYALRDVVSKGYLDVTDGLKILQDVFKSFNDPHQISVNWKTFKKSFWKDIINRSNLNQAIKENLHESPPDLVEFFMRGGVRGIIKYRDFQEFRNKIIMDNVPSFLREDVAMSVWIEFIDLTEDLLFSEPNYFNRLSLVRQHGSFGGVDNTLRISLSLSGGKSRYGVGDVNSVVRSEGAHSIASGIFRNLGMNMDVDELQDRSSALRFPREMDEPNISRYITNTYSEHDRMMIELFNTIISKHSIDDLIWELKNFKGTNIIEDYAIRNALVGLKNDYSSPFAQRILGEAFFYMYRNEPNLEIIDARMPELIEKLKALKEQIDKFSWDVKVFFDGGCYLVTYRQPYPVVAPPIDVILGTEAMDKIKGKDYDEHYAGEWLHYLLRMRIRDLIREGKLESANLHRFYRTSVIYLSSVTRNGELFKQLDMINNDFSEGASGKAIMNLLDALNDIKLRGLTDEMKNDLIPIRNIASSLVKIDRNKLFRIVQQDQVQRNIHPTNEFYSTASGYANLIAERLKLGRDVEAAMLAAGLAGRLYSIGLNEYAREIENVFLPIGNNYKVITDKLNDFTAKYAELKTNSASNLNDVVNIILSLTPESVMRPIENRQILDAEPEKVILKEVGKQLADGLLFSGEIGFSQFVQLLTDYYSNVYRKTKEGRINVNPLAFMPNNEHMWRTIQSQLFPFLNNYDFVNVKKLLTRMREKMQAEISIAGNNQATSRKPTVLYTHWASVVLPLSFMGISLKTIALAAIGWIGIALAVYASAKIIMFALSKVKQHSAQKQMNAAIDHGIDISTLPNMDGYLPFINPDRIKSDKYLMIDVDELLNNWDFITVAGYFVKKQDVALFLHSVKHTRKEIIRRLASAGIDTSRLEIVSADDYRIDKNLNVSDYLRFNFGIDLKQLILLSAFNSSSELKSKLLKGGAVSFEFDMNAYGDIIQLGRDLSMVFQFRSNPQLPPDLRINRIEESNPSFGWFQGMNGAKASFAQFADYLKNSGKTPGLSDLFGVSFAVSPKKSDKKLSARPKLNLTAELIDSSL